MAASDTAFERLVLITRPENGGAETARLVTARGFTPLLAPVLHIVPLPTALPDPAAVAAVLVTSGNAVDALGKEWHGTRLLAVGDATAARARAAGFGDVTSAAGDAAALAALVSRRYDPAGGLVLLAAGRGQGEPLAAALRQAGFRVLRRAVYAAVPATALPSSAIAALRNRRIAAALFFSAETARQFVRLVRRADVAETLAGVAAISIGQPAAVALGALRWRDIRVAARPTQDEMLALLR